MNEQDGHTSKLAGQQSKVRVFVDDISYLMTRIEQGSLASIHEHYEVQEEIHEVQRILADWDAYVSLEMAKVAAHTAVDAAIEALPGVKR